MFRLNALRTKPRTADWKAGRLFARPVAIGLLGACAFILARTVVDMESKSTQVPQPNRTVDDIRRARMVEEQLRARDIHEPRVLATMARVPRHLFVSVEQQPMAYDDRPLPIPEGQTISQPYIVALMTQLARPEPSDRALDVGTGSGYQAAVLAELVEHVDSIEIHQSLADAARGLLNRIGYQNVEVRHGDGYRGWPEHAPFDVIIAAAAPSEVPPALVEQLAPGGRLVLPVGSLGLQTLVVIEKQLDGSTTSREVTPVAFVPMTGDARATVNRSPSATVPVGWPSSTVSREVGDPPRRRWRSHPT